jgi:hypothetical protein
MTGILTQKGGGELISVWWCWKNRPNLIGLIDTQGTEGDAAIPPWLSERRGNGSGPTRSLRPQ